MLDNSVGVGACLHLKQRKKKLILISIFLHLKIINLVMEEYNIGYKEIYISSNIRFINTSTCAIAMRINSER